MEDEQSIVKGIVGLFVVGMLLGLCVLGWIYWLGPLFNQADYSNFNSSPQHLQAVSQKFSDDCLQIATTTNDTAKKALEQDIYQEASTVDLSKIAMPDSTRTCVNNAIYDVNQHK
jgi:hypothetical protein